MLAAHWGKHPVPHLYKVPARSALASCWPSMDKLRPLLLSRSKTAISVEGTSTGSLPTSSNACTLCILRSSERVYLMSHHVVSTRVSICHCTQAAYSHPSQLVAQQAPLTHLPCSSSSHAPVVPIQSSIDPRPLSVVAYSTSRTLVSDQQARSGALRDDHIPATSQIGPSKHHNEPRRAVRMTSKQAFCAKSARAGGSSVIPVSSRVSSGRRMM